MTTVTFKGTPVHLAGTFPKIGQKAPEFVLVNPSLEDKTLQSFGPVKKILLIVPSLETSVCATCTKKFHEKTAGRKDLALLVISADLPFAQKRFSDTEKFTNLTTLSTMRGPAFGTDYGLLIQEGPLKGLCSRAVLLLDEQDHVLYGELVPEITSETSYDQVLALL
jgi:thiol peroxidase